ncbi:unnamed protein product [Cunninghamella echinulata]
MAYYQTPRNGNRNHRHSTPLTAFTDTLRYNDTFISQDTNYIGITISDQEDNMKDYSGWNNTSNAQLYRHSFNGLTDLTQNQQHSNNSDNYMKDIFISNDYNNNSNNDNNMNITERQQQQQQQQQQQHQNLHQRQFRGGNIDKSNTTNLSRHTSLTLPAIQTNNSNNNNNNNNQLPQLPQLKFNHFIYNPTSRSSDFSLPAISKVTSPTTSHFPTIATSNTTTTSSTYQSSPTLTPFSPIHSQFNNTSKPHYSIPEEVLIVSSDNDNSNNNNDHHSHINNNKRPLTLSPTLRSGAFRKVKTHADLFQHIIEKGFYPDTPKPLHLLTKNLNSTYQKCNQGFQYNSNRNPRRVLTKPSKPCGNEGYDNEDFDYILYVNDILGSAEGHRYIILDVLGAGTFGQVVKCKNMKTQEMFAVKVVKNKLAYFKQSMMEVTILEMLNQRYDVDDQHHILRLKDTFIHKKHLCLVFELMSVNLYELIKQNQFRGLSTNLVRVFTAQILDSLTVLNEARIIHCDLKPENILLQNLESPNIKVIDFGSACHEAQTMYTYIQSRFYRSPEVLAGLPYTSAIDMWSLGCIAAELFLGLPLFPGSSEYNQITRIVEMLGLPPAYMIEMGKNSHRYFDRQVDENGQKHYELKSLEQYSREQGKQEQPSKRYFSATTLTDLIKTYPVLRKDSMSSGELEKETQNRLAFIDFLQGLLNLNHFERWSPQQAKQHPFITGEPFNGPFVPPFIPRSQSTIKVQPPVPHLSLHEPNGLSSHFQLQPSQSTSLHGSHTEKYTDKVPFSSHQFVNDPQHEAYLSPAYSSLPNIFTDHHSLPHSSALQHNIRLSNYNNSNNNENIINDMKQPSNISKRASYTLPRVLEPSENNNHYNRDHMDSTRTATSLQMYHQTSHSNNQQQQQSQQQQPQHQSLSITGGGGRPRANTIGTMQIPPPIQLATLDAVTSNKEGRKLGSIRERDVQPSDMNSNSSQSSISPPSQHSYQQQQQHARFLDIDYTDFQNKNMTESSQVSLITSKPLPFNNDDHHSYINNNYDHNNNNITTSTSTTTTTINNNNNNNNNNSYTNTSTVMLSSTIPPIQSTNLNASTSTSHPINISNSHHQYYPSNESSSLQSTLNGNGFGYRSMDSLVQPQLTSKQQQHSIYNSNYHQQHHRQQRTSNWRSSLGNMPLIDLERDADWTEERNSPPPLELSHHHHHQQQHSLTSSTSPLSFADMSLHHQTSNPSITSSSITSPTITTTATTNNHRSSSSSHPHHHHRRSHSSIRYSDVMPSSSSSSSTSSSVISRSSMVSNVASLHRRVRGHPPLAQPYHRQDIEWDGIHSIPSSQQQQFQQQQHLTSFHVANDLNG